MEICYKPTFLRDFKHLPLSVQHEAKERIEQFRDSRNHQKLKVHKLKGKLKKFYSFSVTYSHRIIFEYESKKTIVFLAIGDHDVYN
jgi:mRNA-degrading endonuclease YafQ of YafQ-DinJ toxin-antitoxin module